MASLDSYLASLSPPTKKICPQGAQSDLSSGFPVIAPRFKFIRHVCYSCLYSVVQQQARDERSGRD